MPFSMCYALLSGRLRRPHPSAICELRSKVEREFPIVLFADDVIPPEEVESKIRRRANGSVPGLRVRGVQDQSG